MRNIYYDSRGQEYRCYSTFSNINNPDRGTHDDPAEIRYLAGEILDKKTQIYMNATGEKDYSKAFHLILEANPEYKKAYLNE